MIASAVCATCWVPAGGRTVYEDPDRTLADVERDEVARVERAVKHDPDRDRGTRRARGELRSLVSSAGERTRRENGHGADVDPRQRRAAENRRRVERRRTGQYDGYAEDTARVLLLVLERPGISRTAAAEALSLRIGRLDIIVRDLRVLEMMWHGSKGGREGYTLTENGRQYARALPRVVGEANRTSQMANGKSEPRHEGTGKRGTKAQRHGGREGPLTDVRGSAPRSSARGGASALSGSGPLTDVGGVRGSAPCSSASSAFSAVPTTDPELALGAPSGGEA